MNETLGTRALDILRDWVKSESLRKHCYAVADSMKHFAQLRAADADLWEAVGLLHDMDYERHPNAPVAGVVNPGSAEEPRPGKPGSPIPATAGHPFVGVAWLRENGWSEEICRPITSSRKSSSRSKPMPTDWDSLELRRLAPLGIHPLNSAVMLSEAKHLWSIRLSDGRSKRIRDSSLHSERQSTDSWLQLFSN